MALLCLLVSATLLLLDGSGLPTLSWSLGAGLLVSGPQRGLSGSLTVTSNGPSTGKMSVRCTEWTGGQGPPRSRLQLLSPLTATDHLRTGQELHGQTVPLQDGNPPV